MPKARLSDRELVNRTRMPKPGEDWYRIENHESNSEPTKVYIYDEIGFWGTTASDFIDQLKEITGDIHLHINSPGGRIFDGIAIYNAIKSHPSTVTTIADALAASIASVIFQAGDVRQMTRNATMMIHDGSGLVYGNAEDMRDMAELLDKMSNNIADIYAEAAGGSVAEWRALMQEETWYTGKEAVDAGLADEVLKVEDKKAEEATNKWDMRFFAHSGRSEAPSPYDIRERLAATLNRATKEAPVGQPTNTEEQAPGTGQPGGTEGDDPTKGTEQQEGAPPAGGTGTPAAPAVTTPPAEQQPPAGSETENKSGTIVLNGVQHTVPAPVAQHISTLENFRTETVKNGRKNFVASLAAGPKPKILASQIEKLEAFALSLSPEQFEDWKTSWDAAPGQAMLGNHSGGTSNENGDADSNLAKLKDELEINKEIVASHKRANMPQAQIEKTPSFQRMQELEAQLAKMSQ